MTKEKTIPNEYCAITEQGDLGLGAEVLNSQDQQTLAEQAAKEENK